jgi:hypothetical protein
MNSSIRSDQDVNEAERTKDSHDEAMTPGTSALEYNIQIETVSKREEEKEETDDKDEANKSAVENKVSEASPQGDASKTGMSEGSSLSENSDKLSDSDNPAEELKKPRKKFRSDDPIYWYGILVPPSLRNAQRSFTEGIQTQVPDLASTIVEMRTLEQKITQLRASLEISAVKSDRHGR